MKLPEEIFYKQADGTVTSKTLEDLIVALAKSHKLVHEKVKDGIKQILTLVIKSLPNTPELPEALQKIGEAQNKNKNSLLDFAVSLLEQHVEIKKEQDEKEKTAKELAKKEREAAALAKKREDERMAAQQDEFADILTIAVKKSANTVEKSVKSMISSLKLPSGVSIAESGCGIAFAENATQQDIAKAAGVIVTSLEGVDNSRSALNFMIGDLINSLVNRKVFKSQAQAAGFICSAIKEKTGKSYQTTSINQYALMAARVPAAKRKLGVSPSVYLQASKLSLPRSKDMKESDIKKLEGEIEEFRDELIDEINDGKITDIKQAQAKIDDFKEKRGLKEKVVETVNISDVAIKLAYINFMLNNLVRNDKVVVVAGKEAKEYTLEELAAEREKLEALFIKGELVDKLEYDIDALIVGTKKVKNKKGKEEEVIYRMADPFYVKPPKEDKKEDEAPPASEGEEGGDNSDDSDEGDDDSVISSDDDSDESSSNADDDEGMF